MKKNNLIKIDIEGFYAQNKKVDKGCVYMIKVTSEVTGDKDKFLIEKEIVTGREILKISGHTPPKNFILKMLGKNKRTINLDDKVDLTEPGIEKFVVYPASCTEGLSARRDFPLYPEDQLALDRKSDGWESIEDMKLNWVVIKHFELPEGLSKTSIDVAIKIPPQYPRVELDMIFFPEKLYTADGRELSRQTEIKLNGEIWYQWSRHRDKKVSPWRPGEDNIESHLALMYNCLEKEVG